jgi:hypothetical protein
MNRIIATLKYASLFYVPLFTILSLVFGIAVPALYAVQMPRILIYPAGISWCFIIFLAAVGGDKVAYYLTVPKDERGDFWHIKKVRFIRTIDLSELDKK